MYHALYSGIWERRNLQRPPTPELSHLLSSAFYTGMFEVVIHDMPKDQAVEHIQRMRRFYIAGWKSIFFGDGGENH